MKTIQGMAPAGARSSQFATGKLPIAQSKWQLLKTIEDIREPLGLKGTSISRLRAMISFLRMDHVDATRDDGHICFASNESLAKRAHVSVQTVERHITKLVTLGLLTRRSSGNGKRWARRDRQGNVVLAAGLSLLPLSDRHPEFILMSQAYQDQKNELNQLRDLCSAALAQLKSHLLPSDWDEALFAKARNLLRRRPVKTALRDLLEEVSLEISKIPCEESEDLRGTAPETDGHKETHKIQYVKKEALLEVEVSQDQMEHAYPTLCAELKFAKNQEDCHRIMESIAKQLRLGNTWFTIRDLGPALSFIILGYLLERIDSISNYRGYAFKLAQDISSKSIDWQSLLKRPKSKNIPFA